jgi:hemin uptake protein HemP
MPDPTEQSPPRPAPGVPPVRRIAAQTLLGGGREVVLLLGRDEYRLRLTSKGKLILTK